MMRRVDKYWYRVLGAVHGWVVRRARAHSGREKMRRFRRYVAAQRAHLN
jgi:hypothetical protein